VTVWKVEEWFPAGGWASPKKGRAAQIGRPANPLRRAESAPKALLVAVVLRALAALVLVHLQTTLLLEASHGCQVGSIKEGAGDAVKQKLGGDSRFDRPEARTPATLKNRP
jgi:hypothetical protein